MVNLRTPLNWLHYVICLLGVAPVYSALALPAQIALPLALLGGISADRQQRTLIPDRGATLASLIFFIFYGWQVSFVNLIDPVINILALLIAIRLLGDKSGRHLLQNYTLALFSLAASALLKLDASFLSYLILMVFAIAVSLVLLTYVETDEKMRLSTAELRKIISVALLMPGIALLLMLAFFVILPRTQYPLWNFLNPGGASKVGFSEEVRPGTVSDLAETKTPVFRAKTMALPKEDLYWRGIVLSQLEGNNWKRLPEVPGTMPDITGGRAVAMTIYPELNDRRYLFALDVPGQISGIRAARDGEGVLTLHRPPRKRFFYEIVSHIGATLEAPVRADRWLQLPENISPRIVNLAKQLRAAGATDDQRFAALVNYFRTAKFSYSHRDLPRGTDPVAEFLFERKAGYCEFFASSFALLARLIDIPARLVGGYYGGNYNDLGGYYLVSEDQAHVWVEVLLSGEGWRRFDPSTLAVNATTELLAERGSGQSLAQRLADAADYFWQRAVIVYDFDRQMTLLFATGRNLRALRPQLKKPATTTVLIVLGGLGMIVVSGYWLRMRHRAHPLLRAYLRSVARRYPDAVLPPRCGLTELAEAVNDPRCQRFADIYGGAFYRDRLLTREEREALREIIAQLKSAQN